MKRDYTVHRVRAEQRHRALPAYQAGYVAGLSDKRNSLLKNDTEISAAGHARGLVGYFDSVAFRQGYYHAFHSMEVAA